MLRKATLALVALTVIGLAGTAGASAHGGGAGDYPPAVGYPFLFSLDYQPYCHLILFSGEC